MTRNPRGRLNRKNMLRRGLALLHPLINGLGRDLTERRDGDLTADRIDGPVEGGGVELIHGPEPKALLEASSSISLPAVRPVPSEIKGSLMKEENAALAARIKAAIERS